jgi:hypothetical protein
VLNTETCDPDQLILIGKRAVKEIVLNYEQLTLQSIPVEILGSFYLQVMSQLVFRGAHHWPDDQARAIYVNSVARVAVQAALNITKDRHGRKETVQEESLPRSVPLP